MKVLAFLISGLLMLTSAGAATVTPQPPMWPPKSTPIPGLSMDCEATISRPLMSSYLFYGGANYLDLYCRKPDGKYSVYARITLTAYYTYAHTTLWYPRREYYISEIFLNLLDGDRAELVLDPMMGGCQGSPMVVTWPSKRWQRTRFGQNSCEGRAPGVILRLWGGQPLDWNIKNLYSTKHDTIIKITKLGEGGMQDTITTITKYGGD